MRSHSYRTHSSIEPLESRQLMAAAPVTIATVTNASETGPTLGGFRITRTSTNRTAPLTVLLTVSGTAALNTDYTLSVPASGQQVAVTIPAGSTATNLIVRPLDDTVAEATETVIVTAAAVNATPLPTATMTITDNDGTVSQPVALINGPYRVAERGTLALLGSATLPTGRTVLSYQWDFNYDGTTFDVDATGATPAFNARNIDGTAAGTVRKIALRVVDSASIVSAIATTTITITNAPPTATFLGNTVRQGSNGVVRFYDVTDSAADLAAGLTYRYDFNNDGRFDLTTKAASATVSAGYLRTAGPHFVQATITDKDGGVASFTATITVNRVTSSGRVGPQSVFAQQTLKADSSIDELI